MERIEIQGSSNIASIGWEDQVLEIAFKGRKGNPERVYAYRNVPIEIFHGMLNSPTKGGYFSIKIKGVYASMRIA